MTISVTICTSVSNVGGPFHPSFLIFDISRTISRIELKLDGTGIEKNNFASAGARPCSKTLLNHPSLMPSGVFLFVTDEKSNDFTV